MIRRNHKPSRHRLIRIIRLTTGKIIDAFLLILNPFISKRSLLSGVFPELHKSRIAIYARYGDFIGEERVLIDKLKSLGYGIVIVENGHDFSLGKFSSQDLVILRKNRGFDLAAFRDVIKHLTTQSEVLLINSSLYWNADRLERAIIKIQSEASFNSVTYLTDSRQGGHHGQSYFMYLKLDSIRLAEFQNFMVAKVKNWNFKRMAVTCGEKKVSSYFTSNESIECKFLFSYKHVENQYLDLPKSQREDWVTRLIQHGIKLNPTQHLWPALEVMDFPGIKKSLIDRNPAGLRSTPTIGTE